MVYKRSIPGRVALILSASTALAQNSKDTAAATSSPLEVFVSTGTVASTQATPTGDGGAQSIYNLATSLISQYYPSQTIGNVQTLTFPSTVVIGTSTYTVDPSSVAAAATSIASQKTLQQANPTETSAKATADSHDQAGDKRLGIILGVVIGCVAFAIMGVIFCCLRRRRKDSGSYFRRRTPSTMSAGSWMPPHRRAIPFGAASHNYTGPSDQESGSKYPQTSVSQRPETPPMTMHPAYMQHHSSRSTSDDNPFYTPEDGSTTTLHQHELDGQAIAQLDHDSPARRRSSGSPQSSRPVTPFSPTMMMQRPGPAARPQVHTNPFTSPEDEEAEDVVSPILPPPRNQDRRYSPMVHYPSWDEVSDFDFAGTGRSGPSEDGGDGWHPSRERKDGRYELA